MKEWRPVNKFTQGVERKIIEHSDADEFRNRQVFGSPLNWSASRTSFLKRNELLAGSRVGSAHRFVFRPMLRNKFCLAFLTQQTRGHGYGSARVENMHDRFAILRRNFHRRVRSACRRAANEQRKFESLPLHLPRH